MVGMVGVRNTSNWLEGRVRGGRRGFIRRPAGCGFSGFVAKNPKDVKSASISFFQ